MNRLVGPRPDNARRVHQATQRPGRDATNQGVVRHIVSDHSLSGYHMRVMPVRYGA